MNYAEAWRRLMAASRILMVTHVKPDGDALGSLAAMAEILTARGKQVRVVLSSLPPAKYLCIPGAERFEIAGPGDAADAPAGDLWDLVLVLDTCTWDQLAGLGPLVRRHAGRILVIDHHLSCEDLGDEKMIEPEAAAVGQIVLRLLEANGAAITPTVATALFVALASDTGWFRFANVSAEVYRQAARLQECGAAPDVLFDKLYQGESPAKMRLIGEALAALAVSPEGDVCWCSLTREMFERTGAGPNDTENIVDECQRVAGVAVGLLFVEQEPPRDATRGGEPVEPRLVRVSLRSKREVDVAAVAAQFGGGGHARAAGCTLRTGLAEARDAVLSAVYRALGRAD